MGIIATEDLARTTGDSRNPNYVGNLCVTRSRAMLFGCGINNSYSNNLLVQASDLYYTNLAYEIDPSKCIACGECVRYCQESAINQDLSYYINKRYCVGCGMCKSYCPVSAISGPVTRTGGPNYPPNPLNPPVVDPIISNPAQLLYPSEGGSSFTFSSVKIMVNIPSKASCFIPNQDIRIIIGPPADCTGYYEICRLSSGTYYNVTYDNYGLGYLINESSVTFRLPFLPYNGSDYEVYVSTVFPNGQEDLEIIGTTESGANVYTDNGNLWRCDYVYYNGRCDTIVSAALYSFYADNNDAIYIYI